ncbi:MAG: hypothetical protein ACK4U0_09880 [Mesorhizobium sp.]
MAPRKILHIMENDMFQAANEGAFIVEAGRDDRRAHSPAAEAMTWTLVA